MRSPIFTDPGLALGTAVALLMAAKRPRPPRIYTEAELAALHEEAKREDWNRAVAARKAVKRAAPPPTLKEKQP